MPKKAKTPAPKARPLIARAGARFACFSDGLCCTDLHALGPLTRSEVRAVRKLVPDGVFVHPEVDAHCMRPGPDGGCAQLHNGLCGIHARFGPEHKPTGCRRFPYGLVSTPSGGRVTTESRCPCRTLGERPPIDLSDAERSLKDGAGRLEVDLVAPRRMRLVHGKSVPFERYAELEAGLIERLNAGERAEQVLAARALPELHESSWVVQAAELLEMKDGTRGGMAMAWFGDALLALCEGHKPPGRPRPWEHAFVRAIERSKQPGDPERMLNDWIADELWLLRWLEWGCPFDVARAELATRLAVARWVIARLRRMRVRADQAAAEAIMIAELAACTSQWPETVDAIANDPSPADALRAA